jgi:hypothetical protein
MLRWPWSRFYDGQAPYDELERPLVHPTRLSPSDVHFVLLNAIHTLCFVLLLASIMRYFVSLFRPRVAHEAKTQNSEPFPADSASRQSGRRARR